MSISPVSFTRFARIRLPESAPQPGPAAAAQNNLGADLQTARRELLRLHDAIRALGELLDIDTPLRLDLPDAISRSALGLDLTATAATYTSNAEINATPTSFTPFGPGWTGASTVPITVGGLYDGSDGDGDMTIEVRRSGTRGTSEIRLRVYNPSGSGVDNIRVRDDDPLDMQYALSNGLFLTVGAGSAIRNDTLAFGVSSTQGSVFDPALPFNGERNQNPNFQYYPAPGTLAPVVDGSFLLNGESIAVNAADTLDDLVARINASGTGVTAAYDVAAERLRFEQQTAGSVPTIALGSDTSNLLAALKLDDGVLVAGTDAEPDRPLGDVGLFAGVTSGSLRVNDVDIAVDTATDSLEDVLARINAAGGGVTAEFDRDSGRVRILSSASELTLDDNGTGLLGALQLPEGRVDPQARDGGLSRRRSYAIADAFEEAFTSLNRLFDDGRFADGRDHTGLFRNALASVFTSRLDADGAFGLSFDGGSTGRRRGRFAQFDRAEFTRALRANGSGVQQLVGGGRVEDGLVTALAEATLKALGAVGNALGRQGVFVDTRA